MDMNGNANCLIYRRIRFMKVILHPVYQQINMKCETWGYYYYFQKKKNFCGISCLVASIGYIIV